MSVTSQQLPTAKRGGYTREVEDIFRAHGIAPSIKALRLVPYVHDCIINNNCIDPLKVDAVERRILSDWRKKGRISGGASEVVRCSHDFWKFMSEVLWVAYADYENR